MRKAFSLVLGMSLVGLAFLSGAFAPAEGATPDGYGNGKALWARAASEVFPGCACAADRSELVAYRDRIATAPTADEARDLALSQTRLARAALSRAKWVMPFNSAIGEAREKIEGFEARVRGANAYSKCLIGIVWKTLKSFTP